MSEQNGPRRVSMAYILGFSNKPFKDPRPPVTARPPQASGMDQIMRTPGGIVEWAASDGRRGKLTGPGTVRHTQDWAKKSSSVKEAAREGENHNNDNDDLGGGMFGIFGETAGVGDVSDNGKKADESSGWTEDEDKRLLDWKTENNNKPWDICAGELSKTKEQCQKRFKEIKPKDWRPAGASGAANKKDKNRGNHQNQKQGNNKQNQKKDDQADEGNDNNIGEPNWNATGNGNSGGGENTWEGGDASGGTNANQDSGATGWGGVNDGKDDKKDDVWGGGNDGTWDDNNNKDSGGDNGGGTGDNWNNDAWGTGGKDNNGAEVSWDRNSKNGSSKQAKSNQTASNAGANEQGNAWDNNESEEKDGATGAWNNDGNQGKNKSVNGDSPDWTAGGGWGDTVTAPGKPSSKQNSKPPSNHAASRRSSYHGSGKHSAHKQVNTPVDIELKPDDIFSADDLRLVAKILQQDYQMVWDRVSWRFRDKTGRMVHPEVFKRKITGQVEGKKSGKGDRKYE